MRPGFPEANELVAIIRDYEKRLSALERAARLPFSTIGAGGITVKDGGKISFLDSSGNILFTIDENGLVTFEADGSEMSVLDAAKLRFNRADGTRQLEVTPGGGLRAYEADGSTVLTTIDGTGVQVGSDVVMDADGLQVIGGFVTPIWPFTDKAIWSDVTVTTGTLLAQTTIDPPDWVEQLDLMAVGWCRFRNQASALRQFTLSVTADDGGASEDLAGENMEAADGSGTGVGTILMSITNSHSVALSPAGRSVVVSVHASVSVTSPTQDDNFGAVHIIGFGTRLTT